MHQMKCVISLIKTLNPQRFTIWRQIWVIEYYCRTRLDLSLPLSSFIRRRQRPMSGIISHFLFIITLHSHFLFFNMWFVTWRHCNEGKKMTSHVHRLCNRFVSSRSWLFLSVFPLSYGESTWTWFEWQHFHGHGFCFCPWNRL